MLPSLSVITTSTNSFSRGYLAYLAAIESWAKIADEVVIVDGGTEDNSYEALRQWIPMDKVRIHRLPGGRWPLGQCWHAGQWTINTNIGLAAVETDWVIVICSDYVADLASVGRLREELDSYRDQPGAFYRRLKLDQSGNACSTPLRGVALNCRFLRAAGRPFGYGVSAQRDQPSDLPIYLDERTEFIDPSQSRKCLYRGDWIRLSAELTARCYVYGHYFMTSDQLLEKICNYSWVYDTRYAGRPPKSPAFVRRSFQLSGSRFIGPRDVELAKPHPPSARRVIEHHYDPSMVGHNAGQYQNISPLERGWFRACRALARFSFAFRRFPAVVKAQKWSREPCAPLSLIDLYVRQDRCLPKYMHIRGERDQSCLKVPGKHG